MIAPEVSFPLLDIPSLTVGLGVVIGLVWNRRTGWGCGGIITPGLLALYASDPWRAASALAMGILLTPVLMLFARRWNLYGKERVGVAMLLALVARALLPVFHLSVDVTWIGWVIPGLIAADGVRQGLMMTVCGVLSCATITAFGVAMLLPAMRMFQ